MEEMDVLAKESLDRMRASARPAQINTKGSIFAEGDSWFDYKAFDVLDKLDYRGFDVEHVANAGDKLLEMADLEPQRDRMTKSMLKLAESRRQPNVILISAGGNDLAEKGVLRSLLNHAGMGLPILNDDAVTGFVDVRLRGAYRRLLGFIVCLSRRLYGDGDPIPILVHGYAYPVPDGKPFRVPFITRKGPWLKPEFDKRGYSALVETTAAMQNLLDRFNDMVEDLPKEPGFEHVKYVNLRECMSMSSRGIDTRNSGRTKCTRTHAGSRSSPTNS